MVNIEDVHNAMVLLDPVDDAARAAPSPMAASEWPEERLTDPVRVYYRKRGITKFQNSRGNGFRESLGNRSSESCGEQRSDLVSS
jgi:hypothetical protein